MMATKQKSKPKPQTVDEFLATLDHPYKTEIVTLRQLILDADPRIGEGIKWNAPSFYTTERAARRNRYQRRVDCQCRISGGVHLKGDTAGEFVRLELKFRLIA